MNWCYVLVYQCIPFASNIGALLVCILFLFISVSCQEFSIKPENQAIVLGPSIRFNCRVDGDDPKLQWLELVPGKNPDIQYITFGGEVLDDTKHALDKSNGNFDVIVFGNTTDRSQLAGRYVCGIVQPNKNAGAQLVVLGNYFFLIIIIVLFYLFFMDLF